MNRLIIVFFLVFIVPGGVALAQKQRQMTVAETQDLFNQIRQTPEYKMLQRKADSINRARLGDTPQDVDIKITKQDSNAPDDEIFKAVFARSVMGICLEGYNVVYDRKKRQILSIKPQQRQFKIEQ